MRFTAWTLFSTTIPLCACTNSALVQDGDATFAHATERLERTVAEVEATDASPRDRVLFLQAESLYRYRFTTQRRGTAAVAAEAAAAVTDFPVFQSLAGTLDLVDVRLRSADAAVQLWETFVRRSPESPLRPLALYRLGFAYRSAGAAGLPRDSGDDAFDELLRGGAPPPIAEAAISARSVQWKSKQTAATWSLVPGLGQLYVGDVASGLTRLGVALAATAAIVVPVVIGAKRGDDLTWERDWPLLVSGVGGLVVLSFDYTSSYEDAMRGVVQWNERAETTFESEHPGAP